MRIILYIWFIWKWNGFIVTYYIPANIFSNLIRSCAIASIARLSAAATARWISMTAWRLTWFTASSAFRRNSATFSSVCRLISAIDVSVCCCVACVPGKFSTPRCCKMVIARLVLSTMADIQFSIVWIFFHSSSPRFDTTVDEVATPPAVPTLPLFRWTSFVDEANVLLLLVPLLLPLFDPRTSRSSLNVLWIQEEKTFILHFRYVFLAFLKINAYKWL